MQFDLFAERRGPAVIVHFPIVRRKGLVAATARALVSRDRAAGRTYWRDHLRDLRARLKATGVPKEGIATEIDWYTDAVSRQVVILESYLRAQPDDAA